MVRCVKRLPIGQFVRSVEDKVLKDFSTNRKPTIIKDGQEIENVNYVKHKYNDEPFLDLSILTHAWQWYSKKTHTIIRYNDFYWFKKEGDFHKNDIKVYIDKLSKNELVYINKSMKLEKLVLMKQIGN